MSRNLLLLGAGAAVASSADLAGAPTGVGTLTGVLAFDQGFSISTPFGPVSVTGDEIRAVSISGVSVTMQLN